MPKAYWFLSPQSVVELFKNAPAGSEPISWKVHGNGLPPDAVCVGIQTDGRRFRLELESADFIGGERIESINMERSQAYTAREAARYDGPDPMAPENRQG